MAAAAAAYGYQQADAYPDYGYSAGPSIGLGFGSNNYGGYPAYYYPYYPNYPNWHRQGNWHRPPPGGYPGNGHKPPPGDGHGWPPPNAGGGHSRKPPIFSGKPSSCKPVNGGASPPAATARPCGRVPRTRCARTAPASSSHEECRFDIYVFYVYSIGLKSAKRRGC